MVQGMFEELLCRGFIMGKILQKNLPITAIVVNSLCFAFAHCANDGINLLAWINLLIFALTMSILRLQTESLWLIGAFHSAWNFAEGVIFGTSVSGIASFDLIFKSVSRKNHPLINGGIFGIEASIVDLICGIALLIIVSYRYYIKSSPANLHKMDQQD
ncbi:hypothetical protein XA3_13860 [Xylocopilactobacillus apicola]|uniref:CAAX prenyl protease 2/Lysostaphin resistance protein A-like domain-containing protein n=2 Tax=Xylocopilactobacillus apicola TaxID=2932184 RepID=A0AAU9DBN7_9LACO|nr:hypothetical protein XA3_13860 [Xylocopilactobacillus apicola]